MGEESSVNTIDEYIALFSDKEQRDRMNAIRKTIHEAAPDATERISWKMPTFYLNGNLVHFAMQKKHLGFYPGEDGVVYLKTLSGEYSTSKGAVQFPNTKPLPLELIKKVVKFRREQNLKEAEKKQR